jgi:hypothetical protein
MQMLACSTDPEIRQLSLAALGRVVSLFFFACQSQRLSSGHFFIRFFNSQTPKGCVPIMFWMVARHGTRYPPAQHVTVMKERLPKLRRAILQNHLEHRGTTFKSR